MTGPDIDLYGATDTGRVRNDNQDQFVVADLARTVRIRHASIPSSGCGWLQSELAGHMLLVADGVGGEAGGEEASALALNSFLEYFLHAVPWAMGLSAKPEDAAVAGLEKAVRKANASVLAEQREQRELAQMATTLTVACVVWPRVYVAHVGDSRCYVFRKSELQQVTDDHTLAEELVREGVMDSRTAEKSRFSHVVSQVIGGTREEVAPDVYWIPLAPLDTLILCSDGLTDMLSDEEIADWVTRTSSAQELVESLIEAANESGGTDNVTVVALRAGAA